jgi:hypothetical protein
MTFDEVGKYIRILCHQADKGSLSEEQLKRICAGKIPEIIMQKLLIDDNGNYYQNRMKIEKEKREKHCLKQKERIEKYWNEKEYHGNSLIRNIPLINENENENINEDKNIERREIKFKSEVFEFAEKYPEQMLNKFCNYWTEKNKSKTKMRFELEKTFETSKRLATWASRDKDIVKNEIVLSYEEILQKSQSDPEIWKRYKSVKRDGERKAIFIPIKNES